MNGDNKIGKEGKDSLVVKTSKYKVIKIFCDTTCKIVGLKLMH